MTKVAKPENHSSTEYLECRDHLLAYFWARSYRQENIVKPLANENSIMEIFWKMKLLHRHFGELGDWKNTHVPLNQNAARPACKSSAAGNYYD